jgi:Protein of unknown function (DUF3592)
LEKKLTLALAIFAIAGAALLLGAAVTALDTLAFLRQAETTTAEVIALEEARSSDGDLLYRPVFRFKTRAGREITFRSSTSSAPPAHEVGERVKIGYRDSAPELARDLSASSL